MRVKNAIVYYKTEIGQVAVNALYDFNQAGQKVVVGSTVYSAGAKVKDQYYYLCSQPL